MMMMMMKFWSIGTKFQVAIGSRLKKKDFGRLNYILGITVEYFHEMVVKINKRSNIERTIKKYEVLISEDTDIPIQSNHKLICDLKKKMKFFVNLLILLNTNNL